MEIEAKFLLRRPRQFDEVLETLRRHDYSVTECETRTLVDRYFDTEDWRILEAGWAFRHRRTPNSETLTLKSVGSRDGRLFRRDEIEQPLPAETPTCEPPPPGPVQDKLEELVNGAHRRELFAVENCRSSYRLHVQHGDPAIIELCLDRASVSAPGTCSAALDFTEIELELEAGEPHAVAELAAILEEQAGLLPSEFSKFERGLQAAGLSPPEPEPPGFAAPLSPAEPCYKLLHRFVWQQLRVLQREAPRAREGLLSEGVHQMRIATRRLRAVLGAAGTLVAGGDTVAALDDDLRWLGQSLGQARDADICRAIVADRKTSLDESATDALAPFENSLKEARIDAYDELAATLSTDRYRRTIATLGDIVDTALLAGTLDEGGDTSIEDSLRPLVGPLLEELRRYRRELPPELPAKKLHSLRKRTKRLRYLLEMFVEPLPERAATALAHARLLLDLLGEHQDAETLRDRLLEFAQGAPWTAESGASLLMLGRLIGREEERAARCRQEFPEAWLRFEEHAAAL